MKILNKVSNGVIIMIISVMHIQFGMSSDGFPDKFNEFASKSYYKISYGMDELPAEVGKTNFETFAAFWFFYFGALLIPFGFLIHSIEKNQKYLPHSFTISYLIIILIGVYMVPNSGMTFFMLPHAVFMLVWNCVKLKKLVKSSNI